MNNAHVSDYFRRWRLRYDLTIEQAAQRLFISPEHVRKIEAGKRVPDWVAARVNSRLGYRAALVVRRKSEDA